MSRKVTEHHGINYSVIIAELKYASCVQSFGGETSWTAATLNKTEKEVEVETYVKCSLWERGFEDASWVEVIWDSVK